jgi:hypothetical protein
MGADDDRGGRIEQALCEAIRDKRIISFTLDGHDRIAEPHDYGVIDDRRRLFFFQLGGSSRSGRPSGWRWAELAKIGDLRLLDARFSGPRPIPSRRHQRWDRIIASVSGRPNLGPRPPRKRTGSA